MSTKRPGPVTVGPLRGYARRGPKDGRYYWQVGYHRDRKLHPIAGAGGWHTRPELEQRLAARLAAGDWEHRPAVAPAVTTTDQLLRTWLGWQKRRIRPEKGKPGISPATYKNYKYTAKMITRVIGDATLTHISRVTVQLQRDELARLDYAAGSIQRADEVLRQVWIWGRERGHCAGELARVDLPDVEPAYNHVTPTTEQAGLVVDALKAQSRRWRYICGELLWGTGARVGEVATLEPERVWLARQAVRVHGKTGWRTIPITAELTALLAAWMTEHAPGSWLLGVSPVTVQQHFKTYLGEACGVMGVPAWTPHGFRRLASTVLLGAGLDRLAYEAIMGHSLEQGRKVYAEVIGGRPEVAVALLGRRTTEVVIQGPWRDVKTG